MSEQEENRGLELLREAQGAGGGIRRPGLEIRLAHAYGFCQGVKPAVEQALSAAREVAPSSRLFVTGEIIHNPAINERLRSLGAIPLPPPGTPGRLAEIGARDRVIIPAFGMDVGEEERLKRIGCRLIDTTCGWVRRTWKAAERFASEGRTVVIHGRADHEETRATASRIPGPWIIVRDDAEALLLARAIREPSAGDPLPPARSEGFDPLRDLGRIGLINQTTMLHRETRRIGRILRAALVERRPPGDADAFAALDTFCTATQRRQDAVRTLLESADLKCLIVVGGFRSSNTGHLARLGSERVPTYHVEDAGCLIGADAIRHLVPGSPHPVVSQDWLPRPPRVIGVTAGASTPDAETGRILERLVELHADPGAGAPQPEPEAPR